VAFWQLGLNPGDPGIKLSHGVKQHIVETNYMNTTAHNTAQSGPKLYTPKQHQIMN